MTVSASNRSMRQLWSDLLVALGGSEAYLTRDLSERQVLIEILNTYGGSYSKRTIGGRENILAAIVTAAGGSASPRHGRHELLAALVTALGGTAPSPFSSSTEELLAAAVNAASDGGGGGGDYVAGAVRFGPGSYLIGGASTGTTQVASFSIRVRASDVSDYAFFIGQVGNGMDLSTGFNFAQLDIVMDVHGGNINQGTPDNTLVLNQWMHLAGNIDLNHSQHARLMNLYLDGVSVLDHDLDSDGVAGTASIDRTLDFKVPDYTATTVEEPYPSGEGVPFDVCDGYMIWTDVLIDWSNPTNMAKVRDPITGDPVDPAQAVAAFGNPQVLLRVADGPVISNEGTGAAFTLLTYLFASGSNGAGTISLPGAVAGKSVISAIEPGGPTDYTAEFEAVITVNNQIQQTGATDLSAVALVFQIDGTVTDTDSPSA